MTTATVILVEYLITVGDGTTSEVFKSVAAAVRRMDTIRLNRINMRVKRETHFILTNGLERTITGLWTKRGIVQDILEEWETRECND